MEPQQRARDAAIETVVLTQAAAESYVNWIYLEVGVRPRSRSWISRWDGLGTVAKQLGRPGTSLPSEHIRFFTELNAWRNYLVHGDERARKTLLATLTAQGCGDFTDDAEVISILDSDYAATVIERAEAAFSWTARQTGIQAPFVCGAWVSPWE